MYRFSASQLKKYVKSPAEWAGAYMLKIKKEKFIPAYAVGKAVHKGIEFYNCGDEYEAATRKGIEYFATLVEHQDVEQELLEKLTGEYDVCMENYQLLMKLHGLTRHTSAEAFVKVVINGAEFIGYVDGLDDPSDSIVDYKTAGRVTKPDSAPIGGYGMKPYDEYEFQAWVYMRATGKKKAMFPEILKKKFKTKTDPGTVHEFVWTDEWNKSMEERYFPIIDEMKQMMDQAKEKGVLLDER